MSAPLWTGRPQLESIAGRVWRIRAAAVYFAVLLADGAVTLALRPGQGGGAVGEAKLLAMGVFTLVLLGALAWLTRRTTHYAITEREVVLRFGLALPRKLIIPFGAIAEVKLRVNRDGAGDLALRLREGQRVMYWKLWPHVRGWTFARPEPMLLSLSEPGVVGALLCRAMAADAQARRRALAPEPALQAADEPPRRIGVVALGG
jgi:hypothetical protein